MSVTLAGVIATLGGAYAGYRTQGRGTPAEFVQAAEPSAASPIHVSYSGTGAFRVPGQFAPGTYMVTAGAGDFGCYWERLKAFDGRDSSVLSHGNTNRGGYGRLVVTAKDRGVRMVGDCVWVQI